MFVLLPISHEDMGLRRLPWVTFAIMLACVLASLSLYIAGPGVGQGYARQLEALRSFVLEHPYVEVDKGYEDVVFEEMDAGQREDFKNLKASVPAPDPKTLKSQQMELDRLERALMAAMEDDPLNHWGLVPARLDPITFLTSLFLHAGWIHLIGNLFILYLVGPYVEDVWGRLLYAVLYLASGLLASAAWVYTKPGSPIALVGASGAISGIMGAFLIRFWKTKVSFFYMIFVAIRGTFRVPAWVLLPLWFIEQVYLSSLTPAEAGGVAYVAHAVGFGFGVLAGLAFMLLRIEERFMGPRIEQKAGIQVVTKPALERALVAKGSGDKDVAFGILKGEAARNPHDKDVLMSLWDTAVELGRADQAAAALEQVIRLDLNESDPGMAAEHWLELDAYAPSTHLGATALLKIGQALRDSGDRRHAMRALKLAMQAAGSRPAPQVAFTIARTALGIDNNLAREAARMSLVVPGLDRQDREVAERLAAEDESEPPILLQK